MKLKVNASAWWDRLEVNRQRSGKRPIRSWEKMKCLMKKRFLSPNCEQGLQSIANIEEFHQLGVRTNLVENEQHLIARFIGGLLMDIKE